MAIEFIEGPTAETGAGPFTLPAEFERDQFAASWKKKGPEVNAATQREQIQGTRLTADGWSVWKDPTTKKPHSAFVKDGEFILMCRPRLIQDQVNAIYGNVGKGYQLAEKRGETAGGVRVTDPGILSDERLSRVAGRSEYDDGEVIMNKVPDVPRVTTPTLDLET